MRIDVITLFPDLIRSWGDASLLGRATRSGLLDLRVHDLRSAASDPRHSVDDSPYGGGAGMVLCAEPVFVIVEREQPKRPLFLLAPSGRRFDQSMASSLACSDGFSLICGRYEGVDQRVSDHLCDGEISLGDFVLSGGEVAALAVIEAVARLVPGVMGNTESADEESFSRGLLEYPQYTRPLSFRGWEVPTVLVGGHHGLVSRWRHAQALARTVALRPDIIESRGGLSDQEQRLLDEFDSEPLT